MADFVAGQKVKLVRDFEPDRRTEAPSDGILLPALGEIYTVRSVGYEPEFGSILFLEEIVNETKFYLDAFKVMEQGFDPTRFQLVAPTPPPSNMRVTAEEHNAAFDPANDALGGAFKDGFREGWLFAQDPDFDDREELERDYHCEVDIAPSECWDAYREKYFAMLPLAAIPEVG